MRSIAFLGDAINFAVKNDEEAVTVRYEYRVQLIPKIAVPCSSTVATLACATIVSNVATQCRPDVSAVALQLNCGEARC